MAASSTISFPAQETVQKAFLEYIQNAPFADWAKDEILSFSNPLSPILPYPPLECFPRQEAVPEIPWRDLCLCAAYSLHFLARYEKDRRQTLKFYELSRLLMAECQRICGSIFPLEHTFWKRFYQRIALQYNPGDLHNGLDQPVSIHYRQLSFFLLPVDMLSLSGKLTAFQYEMLEQSLLSVMKGFYNMECHPPAVRKKLFKEALLYSNDISLDYYDRWISHYANMVLHYKTPTT